MARAVGDGGLEGVGPALQDPVEDAHVTGPGVGDVDRILRGVQADRVHVRQIRQIRPVQLVPASRREIDRALPKRVLPGRIVIPQQIEEVLVLGVSFEGPEIAEAGRDIVQLTVGFAGVPDLVGASDLRVSCPLVELHADVVQPGLERHVRSIGSVGVVTPVVDDQHVVDVEPTPVVAAEAEVHRDHLPRLRIHLELAGPASQEILGRQAGSESSIAHRQVDRLDPLLAVDRRSVAPIAPVEDLEGEAGIGDPDPRRRGDVEALERRASLRKHVEDPLAALRHLGHLRAARKDVRRIHRARLIRIEEQLFAQPEHRIRLSLELH